MLLARTFPVHEVTSIHWAMSLVRVAIKSVKPYDLNENKGYG